MSRPRTKPEKPLTPYRKVAVFVEPGMPHDGADTILHVFGSIAYVLARHGRVSIPGVGTFHATSRKARRIRNPVTKELMMLPETKSVRFKPSKDGVFG